MKTELVRFNDADIICIVGEFGKIDIVIKPICDHLGLDSKRQIRTITEDDILRAERCVHIVQLKKSRPEGSEQTHQVRKIQPRKMVCLPLEFLNGWLFQIKLTNTMSEETKAKLVDYKRKCYKALFQHFFGNMKKQIEMNEIEIALLEQIAKYGEDKTTIAENLKKAQRQLAKVRENRLTNVPSLF